MEKLPLEINPEVLILWLEQYAEAKAKAGFIPTVELLMEDLEAEQVATEAKQMTANND